MKQKKQDSINNFKTKEEILEEVYFKKGSPVKFAEDKTFWKEIALEAMQKYHEQFNN
jgi:hypothetical protein